MVDCNENNNSNNGFAFFFQTLFLTYCTTESSFFALQGTCNIYIKYRRRQCMHPNNSYHWHIADILPTCCQLPACLLANSQPLCRKLVINFTCMYIVSLLLTVDLTVDLTDNVWILKTLYSPPPPIPVLNNHIKLK